jgi:protein-disulfide isomerase
MNEHNKHTEGGLNVTENYKEEGALTLESLEVAAHDAATHEAHRKHSHKSGFTLTTPMAIIIASIIIAGGLMGYGAITSGGSSNSVAKTLFKGKAINASDFVEGKENSKVVVIEYSDPECPFCTQVSPTIKKLRTDYAGKIAFVYRHFPLTQIHKHAFDEARAIACAGKVGGSAKYYEYLDNLFAYQMNKQSTELPVTGKEDFAKAIGIDMTAFGTCMKDNQTAQTVTDSANDGVAAGVQGTPSTFILVKTRKGYEQVAMIDGARQYEFFKASIEEALAR